MTSEICTKLIPAIADVAARSFNVCGRMNVGKSVYNYIVYMGVRQGWGWGASMMDACGKPLKI